MSVFVDRQEELSALDELWGMRRQVALLWGRRRVGKSALLQRFAEGKPTISFQADQGTASEQPRLLTERMLAYRPDPFLTAAPLANWDQALAHLLGLARAAKAEGHPLLVLLDEFPYLVTSTPRLPSAIQAVLEDVRREVKDRVETFRPYGGFTISPSQHLMTDIPVENIVAMYEAAWEYCWLG